MKFITSSLMATIAFSAAAGLLLTVTAVLPLPPALQVTAKNALLFLCLTAYSAFLARSSGRPLGALLGPLFILATVLSTAASVTGFVFPAVAGLSWIRSGLCFKAPIARRMGAEALICAGGLTLSWLLLPPGPCGEGLGLWMFGLIQALYFWVVNPELKDALEDEMAQTHRRAASLLQERKLERAFEKLGL
jgi:hypothetical protein